MPKFLFTESKTFWINLRPAPGALETRPFDLTRMGCSSDAVHVFAEACKLAYANRVEGAKRPRSSMSPTIVFKNNEPYLIVGSPGGSRIINYVVKTIVAVLDWGMLPQDALNLGHFVNPNGPTDLEEGTGAVAFKQSLEARGHKVNIRNLNSGLHAILIKDGTLIGGADPRREGIVMGE